MAPNQLSARLKLVVRVAWNRTNQAAPVLALFIALVALYIAYRDDARGRPQIVMEMRMGGLRFGDTTVMDEAMFGTLIRNMHFGLNTQKHVSFFAELGLLSKSVPETVQQLDEIWTTSRQELEKMKVYFPIELTAANNGVSTTVLSCRGTLTDSVDGAIVSADVAMPRLHLPGGEVTVVGDGVEFVAGGVPGGVIAYYMQIAELGRNSPLEQLSGYKEKVNEILDAIGPPLGRTVGMSGFFQVIELSLTFACTDQHGSTWSAFDTLTLDPRTNLKFK